jgi:hypothetical protein
VPFAPDLDYRRPREPGDPTAPVDTLAAVTRWNALEAQLVEQVGRLESDTDKLSFRSRRMLEILLRRCSKLSANDPRNLPLERAAAVLHLATSQVAALKATKVRDLKTLAQALLAAPAVERLNAEVLEFVAQLDERERCKLDLKPIKVAVSSREAEVIIDSIGATLATNDKSHEEQHGGAIGGNKRRRGGKAR